MLENHKGKWNGRKDIKSYIPKEGEEGNIENDYCHVLGTVIYLRGIDKFWVIGAKDFESLGQQVLVAICLNFNLKKQNIFYKKYSPCS